MRLKKSTLALTLTVALLATSCATPRKAMQETRTEAQSSISRQTEATILLQEETAAMIERMVKERFRQLLESTTTKDEAAERITEIFDTSQPIDSVTGTPPLQSRVTERSESREKNDTRTQNEATSTARTEADIGTKTDLATTAATSENEEIRKKGEARSREERKASGTLVILEIAAGAIISLFLLWLLLTVGKAIKSFSKTN